MDCKPSYATCQYPIAKIIHLAYIAAMTKTEALTLFDGPTELAKALDIKPQAVSQWEADRPIPRVHYMRLRYELMPEAFKKDGTLKQARS